MTDCVLMFRGVFKASLVTRFVHCTDIVLKLMHTLVDLLAFSLNRVFVVETFSMLISQRQTLVSSDTSCAMGIRRDVFVLFHSLTSLYFFSYLLVHSLQALTESGVFTDQC